MRSASRRAFARVYAPCVVHRNERRILRYDELHGIVAEAAVLDKAHIGLPCGYGAGAAADGLKIVVGNASYGRRGREYGGCHAVAASDVLGAALGVEHRRFESYITEVYGVEVVASLFACDELDAGIERLFEPERRQIVVGHRQQQAYVVLGAYLGEGACRIAGRGYDQHLVGVTLVDAGAYAVCLGLLERAGGHRRTSRGAVAAERYI